MFNYILLDELLDRITNESRQKLIEHNLACDANMENAKATVFRNGRKFVTIAVGTGIRYFVRKDDGSGTIFAGKSWKTPNLNRSFGTLSDQRDFTWGDYEARAKPGTPWTMVPTRYGYATAVSTLDKD